ncbi:MAG: penicillin-binding protein 2 [Alphaproteobacteria bacterium]|nr:penicillin-binding protein 2 [Alphaproteobacteria bacterium]
MSIWRSIGKKLAQVPTADAKNVARQRLLVATALGAACFTLIAGQVVNLSTVDTSGKRHHRATAEVQERGKILDRNGRVLATSLPAYLLYADPAEIMNPYEATLKLSEILPGMTEEGIFSKLTQKGRYAELSWRVSPATYAKALENGVVGVYGKKRITRFYPQKEEAAHVIGVVNKDSQGLAGIEAGMNTVLAKGEDVHLSVDIAVQAILRKEIEEQMAKFEAIGGAGVVLDVKTGELLALASLPQYDANHFGSADDNAKFNRATKGTYELGSTFKILNTAMALESRTFDITDKIDVVSPLRVGRFPIRDYHPEKKPLNVAEVMVVSSNIGSARMADEMGADLQKKYLGSLGLLSRLELEVPEVASPQIPTIWRRANVMTISYGHGISVTPTHLAAAIATTVGNGTRVHPSLIKGGVKKDFDEQVFSAETVGAIRATMRRVVNHKRGTGKKANAKGYVVGGKTGTSEKHKVGGYDKKLNIASFAATFPAHDPRYVVVVMVDEPKGQKFSHGFSTGGWVAAPAVRRFITRAAPLLNVAPVDEKSPEIRQLLAVDLPQLDAEKRHASF